MDTVTYYKVLSKGHRACHGGKYTYRPNRWTKRLPAVACESGYHIVTVDNLTRWLFANGDDLLPLELWEVEAEGVTDAGEKSVAERIRLTRLVGTLDEYDLRWLGTEFAIMCLHNTTDPRAGECINTVRAYSLGMADASDLSAAYSVAYSVAYLAADSAARSVARSVAYLAADSAAYSAAYLAAYSAARSVAYSAARSVAYSAADSAAYSAARSAAYSAAGQIVLDYLNDDA